MEVYKIRFAREKLQGKHKLTTCATGHTKILLDSKLKPNKRQCFFKEDINYKAHGHRKFRNAEI